MKAQQYGRKPAPDTFVLPAANLLQTRPFQPQPQNSQSTPQLQESSAKNSFDLTEAAPLYAGHPISLLNQPLQAKLTIGQPNDKYEQEADRVAHDVVQRIHAADVADPPSQPLVQWQNETLQRKPFLQSEEAFAGNKASPELGEAISQPRSSGQPLDANLQRQTSQAMEAELTHVQRNTDEVRRYRLLGPSTELSNKTVQRVVTNEMLESKLAEDQNYAKTIDDNTPWKEAISVGNQWVGAQATKSRYGPPFGYQLISQNGTRQFRPPMIKKNSKMAGQAQANYEWRPNTMSKFTFNAHATVPDIGEYVPSQDQ